MQPDPKDSERKEPIVSRAGGETGAHESGEGPGKSPDAETAAAFRYAGLWRRLIAFVMDYLTFVLVESVVWGVVAGVACISVPRLRADAALFDDLMYVIPWVEYLPVLWLYHAIMESSALMATAGKMALGIIVTDYQGARITFGRASGRFWAKALSLNTLCIGFLIIGLTKKKQGMHDMLASTLVVCKVRY